MYVGGTPLYQTLKARKDFSEAQAYLLAEVAYTSGASLLWTDTWARRTTYTNLARRGLLTTSVEAIIIELTDAGKDLVLSIQPNIAAWASGHVAGAAPSSPEPGAASENGMEEE